nr:MAG TPA: protein of unknown function DUF3846 [Caudoviricetes sp.]
MGIHIAVIEPGRDPYLKEVEPEDREGREASYLGAFQREVGGNVEADNVLWGDQPLLYVNDKFLLSGLQPNRAIYANAQMEEERYLSIVDCKSVVKRGDVFGVIFGTFIAVSYDPETDKPRDISIEEWLKVCAEFAGIRSILSGCVEATKLKSDFCTEYIKVNLPGSEDSYKTGNGEGVWVLVSEQAKAAYDRDAEGFFALASWTTILAIGLGLTTARPFPLRCAARTGPLCPTNGLQSGRARP